MMKTLLLDVVTWDLVLDVSGNIAVASDPYSMSQDMGSALKLFRLQDDVTGEIKGELWYNTEPGIPYFIRILGPGKAPPLSLVKEYNVSAALRVPGIVAAECFISGLVDRRLTGQVQGTDKLGRQLVQEF